MRFQLAWAATTAFIASGAACSRLSSAGTQTPVDGDEVVNAIRPLAFDTSSVDALKPLADAIGDKRIVLIGENGHGVSQFSRARVQIVRYLHERMGFDVVAFESGFHECREAEARLGEDTAVRSLQRCLLVQSHHAELLPLFEYIRERRQSTRPITIAGIDLQIQSFFSRSRPQYLREQVRTSAPAIADSVALLDSIFIEKNFQPSDSLRSWLAPRGRRMKALYDSGAALTTGDAKWTFLAASELVRRELLRLDALAQGREIPAAVYDVRDDWMARSIARVAGPSDRLRKVAVLLHNDHARYGEWEQGAARVRSTGQFLRAMFPNEVYAIGFLMGGGTFANNSRRERQVATPIPGAIESVFVQAGLSPALLTFGKSASQRVKDWGDAEHPYIRGSATAAMRPSREFDALIYFRQVSPASYQLR